MFLKTSDQWSLIKDYNNHNYVSYSQPYFLKVTRIIKRECAYGIEYFAKVKVYRNFNGIDLLDFIEDGYIDLYYNEYSIIKTIKKNFIF